jgi:hypothetical protein
MKLRLSTALKFNMYSFLKYKNIKNKIFPIKENSDKPLILFIKNMNK